MKKTKVFIIDDDDTRQQTKFKPFLDLIRAVENNIEWIHKTTQTSTDAVILNAACVCLHTTTKDGNDKDGKRFDFEQLKIKLIEQDIPHVLFSNAGNRTTDLEDNITLSMSSDDFYMNLPGFIENIKHKNVIDLEVLALGKNYRREKFNRQKVKLLSYFDQFDEDDPLFLNANKRKAFRDDLEIFEVITQDQSFTSSVFTKLNSDMLTLIYFEHFLSSIVKFIR